MPPPVKEVRTVTKYWTIEQKGNREADVLIFGDITSLPWEESDASSYRLANEIKALDTDTINVHINSYGGEVAEGLAIHNTLKESGKTVRTYCDGFACSAASVVFMAGNERVMNPASLLMVHNASMIATGNPAELRKQADDLDIINEATKNAYRDKVNLSEAELTAVMDAETWIDANRAVREGWATSIATDSTSDKPTQSARMAVHDAILGMAGKKAEPEKKEEPAQEQSTNHLNNFLSAFSAKRKE